MWKKLLQKIILDQLSPYFAGFKATKTSFELLKGKIGDGG